MVVTSATGLPWYVSATVISLAHMESLRKESVTSAPGEHPEFLGIRYAVSPDPAPGDPLPVAVEPGASRASRGASCVSPGVPLVPVAIKAEKSRDPGDPEDGRGLRAPEGPCGTRDTCAASCREQRLTGLAVFVLMGVSVFMAPVLKVRSLAAGFGLFSKAGGWPYPARLGGSQSSPTGLSEIKEANAAAVYAGCYTGGDAQRAQPPWELAPHGPLAPLFCSTSRCRCSMGSFCTWGWRH